MQLAYLDQLNTSFSNTGLKVLTINLNKPKILNLVKPYVSKRKYKFDVSIDPRSKLADKLSVEGIPTIIFADKNGNILYRSSGYADGYENEYLKELIKYLDKENIPYDDFTFKDKASRRKEAIVDIDF
jgi:thioredoxin-related protein